MTAPAPHGSSYRARWLVTILVAAGGVSCRGSEPPATSKDEILGGRVEHGYPEVGALRAGGQGFFCTGTLITPRYVLTAGHCFDFGRPAAEFVLGEQVRTIASHAIHPRYVPRVSPSSAIVGVDLAIVRLAAPIPAVTPARLSDLDELAGHDDLFVRSVGLGIDDDHATGTKRSALEWITGIQDQTFTTHGISGSTADGDSGGPVYLGRSIVGTTSSGFRMSVSMKVGGAREWLDEATEAGITWVRAEAAPDPGAPQEVCERATANVCTRADEDVASVRARELASCLEAYHACGEPPAFAVCSIDSTTCDRRATCSMLPKTLCLSSSPPASWPATVRESACEEYVRARAHCAGAGSREALLADCSHRFDECHGRVPASLRCATREQGACDAECLARPQCL